MMDDRGTTGVFVNDRPNSAPPPRAPEAPVDTNDILGASWTLARQVFAGAKQTAEYDAYGPILNELHRRDDRSWLAKTFVPSPYLNTQGGVSFPVQEGAVWAAVERYRKADPTFMKDVPAKNAAEFKAWVQGRETRERRAAQDVKARQSGLGQNALGLAADIGSSLADPINLLTLPLGVGGAATKSIAAIAAREALVSGATAVLALPTVADNRARFGEDFTLQDMAIDVGIATAGGAVLGGGIAAGVKVAGAAARKVAGAIDAQRPIDQQIARAIEAAPLPDDDLALARDFARRVPLEQRTPDERAALHVIERQADIDASNPFAATVAGLELHAERLQAAIDSAMQASPLAPPLVNPAQMAAVAPPLARGGVGAIDQVMARIGRVENASGGGDVRNPNSSATGKYQFTDGTWLRNYKQTFGAGGLSDAEILAKRAYGGVQDQVMRVFTQGNARFLNSIGAPETAGNLYLTHFAGQGGAAKILKAAPDTPIEQVLTADAIAANGFLKGKTAGDVIDWAHAKMGEASGARVTLNPDNFADDVELRMAQQALDDAVMAKALASRAAPDAAEPAIVGGIDTREEMTPWQGGAIEVDAPMIDGASPSTAPADLQAPVTIAPDLQVAARALVRDRANSIAPGSVADALGIEEAAARRVLAVLADDPANGLVQTKSGAVRRRPLQREQAPLDVLSYIAREGGILRPKIGDGAVDGYASARHANVGRHDLLKGRGYPAFSKRGGALFRSTGMTIDELGELLSVEGFLPPGRATEADVLALLDDAVAGKLVYRIRDTEAVLDIADQERLAEARARVESQIGYNLEAQGFELDPADYERAADLMMTGDYTADEAVLRLVNEQFQDVFDAAAIAADKDFYAQLAEEFERTIAETDRRNAGDFERPSGDPGNSGAGDPRAGQPRGAAADDLEAARLAPPPSLDLRGDPRLADADGDGIRAIVDSQLHDIRAELQSAPESLLQDPKQSARLPSIANDNAAVTPVEIELQRRWELTGRELESDASNEWDAAFDEFLDGKEIEATGYLGALNKQLGRNGKTYQLADVDAAVQFAEAKTMEWWQRQVDRVRRGVEADFADDLNNTALDAGAKVDPAIAARQAQQTALKAASPLQSTAEQQGAIGSPLFDAVDQPGFRLDEGGDDRAIADILADIDADDAAIKAARGCLL